MNKYFQLTIATLALLFFDQYTALGQKNGRLTKKDNKEVSIDTLSDTLLIIDKIHILGNKKTKTPIITRELGFREGDEFYSSELRDILEASKNNVYNTQLFSTVNISQLDTSPGHVEILVELEERWYFYPSFVFRLIDQNFNDWWVNRDHDFSRVKYGVKLEQYNFRGRKEKLKLIALFGYENWYLLNYEIPYIDKSQKHGLSFGFAYQNNKNVAYQTTDHVTEFIESEEQMRAVYSGSVSYSFRPSFYNYHYLTLSGFHTNISDTMAIINPNYLGNGQVSQSLFKLDYTFRRDIRDNQRYPLKGRFSFAQVEKVGLGIFDDVDIWRLTLNHSEYIDLGKEFYFSTSLGGQLSNSKDVPYYNYIYFGEGTYYIRGYELNRIEGPQNILSKNTFKKKLFGFTQDISPVMPIKKLQKIPFAFYGKVFADGGWINNYPNYDDGLGLTNRLLYGVGIGLDMVTLYDLTLRLEYSYNAENDFNFFINFSAEL